MVNEAATKTVLSGIRAVTDAESNQSQNKESSTTSDSEAVDSVEIQKYEEAAVKAMTVVMVQMRELLTEAFDASNPDSAVTKQLIASRDKLEIQGLLSSIYNNISLIGKMVNLSSLDVASQLGQINEWNANNLSSQIAGIELPTEISLDQLKQLVKDFIVSITDDTALGALANSFTENYEKRDGKFEKKVELFNKIKESLEKNPKATAFELAPLHAENQGSMTDDEDIFNEHGLTALVRDIYQIVSSPKFAKLQG